MHIVLGIVMIVCFQVLKNFKTGEVESCVSKDGHDVLRTRCGEPPNVDIYHFETSGVVGNGSFGVVFEATCLETTETVRAKDACSPQPLLLRRLRFSRSPIEPKREHSS
jgi:hypothetical protein